MDAYNNDSGWKYEFNLELNVREIEERMLELISISPFDKNEFHKLRALLEVQESLFGKIFADNVWWDIEMICEMVERNLLDKDGQ